MASAHQLIQDAEVSDRLRTDFAAMDLAARLHGQVGRHLKVDVGLPGSFDGLLGHVGRGWIVLQGRRPTVVALDHAVLIAGMDRFSAADAPAARLGLASALRGLSRDRAAVQVYLAGQPPAAALDGSIDRVGKDYFELSLTPRGEPRRPGSVLGAGIVPLRAVAAVSSAA
ncbi:hypothetical protein OL239_05970 [Arthrobacter sp. ATA002]|uniref:hypothetical protein n=1 Tax=Arthrobacter sp. ATA002 TaxID=2991715 RepID=UPI0022A74F94|nr:hypothetical protein [Arthrobacter sp. ATA002]WAP52740.1 hypothetical protein OL239_05970 [Arthrobacter sp. ATA002]